MVVKRTHSALHNVEYKGRHLYGIYFEGDLLRIQEILKACTMVSKIQHLNVLRVLAIDTRLPGTVVLQRAGISGSQIAVMAVCACIHACVYLCMHAPTHACTHMRA